MSKPDDVRARFEVHHGISWESIQTMPTGSGSRLHLESHYKRHFETWQAAHADLSGEVRELVEADSAVDEADAWAWRSDGMTGWALGHIKPTPENTYKFHERNTVVRGLYFHPTQPAQSVAAKDAEIERLTWANRQLLDGAASADRARLCSDLRAESAESRLAAATAEIEQVQAGLAKHVNRVCELQDRLAAANALLREAEGELRCACQSRKAAHISQDIRVYLSENTHDRA